MAEKLIPWREVLDEQLKDPEFRALWESTALAREVANWVIGYRVEHHLSQTALGRRLGIAQSQVARLEDGEHEPRLATLRRLADVLGMTVSVTVTPPKQNGTDRSTVTIAVE